MITAAGPPRHQSSSDGHCSCIVTDGHCSCISTETMSSKQSLQRGWWHQILEAATLTLGSARASCLLQYCVKHLYQLMHLNQPLLTSKSVLLHCSMLPSVALWRFLSLVTVSNTLTADVHLLSSAIAADLHILQLMISFWHMYAILGVVQLISYQTGFL